MDSAFMERLKRRPGSRIRARTKNMRPEAAGQKQPDRIHFSCLYQFRRTSSCPANRPDKEYRMFIRCANRGEK